MPDSVVIEFTGNVSIEPGSLLAGLKECSVYDATDPQCGYSVLPAATLENPMPRARKVQIWGPGNVVFIVPRLPPSD